MKRGSSLKFPTEVEAKKVHSFDGFAPGYVIRPFDVHCGDHREEYRIYFRGD